MADFNSAYHKFCPVEVNGCPRVRNLALPPINCQTAKLATLFNLQTDNDKTKLTSVTVSKFPS